MSYRIPQSRRIDCRHIDTDVYGNREETITAVGYLDELACLLVDIDLALRRGGLHAAEAVAAARMLASAERSLDLAFAFASGNWHEMN